jgi:SEC-C motif-containing protein
MKHCSPDAPCPCGKTIAASKGKSLVLAYTQCCGRWLEGTALAPDAESLMRSRYCAFVLEREDYLRSSWLSSNRPASIEFEPDVKWLGLEVRQHVQSDETHATVEFVARSKSTGAPAVRLHERSRFVREAGQWLYTDGDQL